MTLWQFPKINLRGAPQSHFLPGWFSQHVYRGKSPNPVWSLACTTASAPQPNLELHHWLRRRIKTSNVCYLHFLIQREVKPAIEPWLQAESTYPSSTRYGGFGRFQGTCDSFLVGLCLSSKCHVLAILAIPTIFQLKHFFNDSSSKFAFIILWSCKIQKRMLILMQMGKKHIEKIHFESLCHPSIFPAVSCWAPRSESAKRGLEPWDDAVVDSEPGERSEGVPVKLTMVQEKKKV